MITSKFAKFNFLIVAIVAVVLYFVLDTSGRPSDWQRFFGRMHPAAVHLPIGILIFGLILSALRSVGWIKDGESVVDVALVLGSWFGVVAILAGSWLAQIGGYPDETMFRHKLAGYVATVVAALILYLRHGSAELKWVGRLRQGLWVVVVGALAYGGDLGGRMTHGEGFASEYAPGFVRPLLGEPTPMVERLKLDDPAKTTVFDAVVAPILQDKCAACHGAERAKGRLRLHTAEVIAEHKGDEPLLVAGRPGESLLIQRVSLPQGHDDVMPPAFGAKPISPADVELLKWWVAEGASFEQTVTDTPMPAHIRTLLNFYGLGEIKTGIFALEVAMPDTNRIAALRMKGASVNSLAAGSPFLSVKCEAAANCFSDGALAALGPHIAWLDLGDSDVTDSQLSTLSRLLHLTRLDLSRTGIRGSGLKSLEQLAYLEYLNLYESKVDDAGVKLLEPIKSLQALYLWQTGVTGPARDALQDAIPDLKINTGATN